MHRVQSLAVVILSLAITGTVTACGGQAEGSAYPIRVTDAAVARGEALYAQQCAYCHGLKGEEPPLPGAPPHDAEITGSHTWHHSDRQLVEWILDRPPMAQVMPAFRGTLDEQEVMDVIAYIKSWWPDDVRARQEDFTRQYERQIAGQ